MTWILLLTLAVVVFVNRYLFLEPRLALHLPIFFQRMLQYSAPCLLTAICAPIIFYDGALLRQPSLNAYVLSAIFCVVIALFSTRILTNLILGLLCFYSLNFLLSS